MKGMVLLGGLLVVGCATGAVLDRGDLDSYAYQQAATLVQRMSLDEKIKLIEMDSLAVESQNIPAHHWWSEGIHGISRRGKATSFPVSICQASTWNPALIEKMGAAIGDEARALHHADRPEEAVKRYHGLTIWSPTINMARDPRWGRTEETYGEDPLLTSLMGSAFVTGIQGDNPQWLKTVATVKHYVANNTEHNRLHVRPSISERALREYYLPAFRVAVEDAGVESIMVAYNGINGTPCGADRWLLHGLLREEWGFKGTVVTDVDVPQWLFKEHQFVKDGKGAAAVMLKAGVDVYCGGDREWAKEAIEAGLLTEPELDRAVTQNVATRIKLGLLRENAKNPYAHLTPEVVGCEKHLELARRIAAEGMVLLKNENNVLPATTNKYDRIIIAGPHMNNAPLGEYSGTPTHPSISAAKALPELLGDRFAVQTLFGGTFQPVPNSNLHLEGDPDTSGLKAEYFANRAVTGEVAVVRVDPAIDFNWPRPLGHVDPDIPQPTFSVRWTGELVPNRTGQHVFSVKAHEGARVFLNDEKILDIWNWGDEHSEVSKPVDLVAGEPSKLRVEYFDLQRDEETSVKLSWSQPLEEKIAGNPERELMVYIGGMKHGDGAEAKDFATLKLPTEQIKEIRELSETYPHMVVALFGGTTVEVAELSEIVPSILLEWFPGQQGGYALADLISGAVNPAGRLPLTFHTKIADLPDFENYEINKGRTYMYATNNITYPFGHGLSYTKFIYGDLKVSKTECEKGDTLKVSVDVTNAGARDGDEVVQLYVSNLDSLVYQPQQQLKAFKRIHIPDGETVTVELPLEIESLSWWDEWKQAFVVDSGRYTIKVGASSTDIRAAAEISVK